MFKGLALVLMLCTLAQGQVVRMTDGEVGYKWTGFAIDEDHILTVAHADHDVAYVYTQPALIACDRIAHDTDRDIALFKCRMKHGQPLAKIAQQVRGHIFKISGFPEGKSDIKTLMYPRHSTNFNAKLRSSGEIVLLLEGKAYMGMSGSPVVDETGEVVGIQSTGGPDDTFCVSLDQIRNFLNARWTPRKAQ